MTTAPKIIAPKKLIEVALPLDEINKAAAREKSIRHGHPSTLHIWWAPRPLAAARAVVFSQLVNDPGWKYSDEDYKRTPQLKSAVTRKRSELFKLITKLVQWASTNDETVLEAARAEIRASWRETCEANRQHPDAKRIFDPERLPKLHDPFAGGGSIPLESQRLGLDVVASDLNPVAVFINKAKLDAPARFAGKPPVGPTTHSEKQTRARETEAWRGAQGLAEDVQRYGDALAEAVRQRIGKQYPSVVITKEMVRSRPDLARYEGRELTVVAWLWARTVPSPSPIMNGAPTPLVNTFWVAKKEGKEAWVEPIEVHGDLTFRVHRTSKSSTVDIGAGTKAGRATFRCFKTNAVINEEYVKKQGKAGNLSASMMAIVCEGDRERVYIDPLPEHISAATSVPLSIGPESRLPDAALGFRIQPYGFVQFRDLFSPRQRLALQTIADQIVAMRAQVANDAVAAGWSRGVGLDGGGDGAEAYADAICGYLAMLLGRCADFWSTLATWSADPKNEVVGHTFGMQTLPMTWDYGEINPFSGSGGSLSTHLEYVTKAIAKLPACRSARVEQAAAQEVDYTGEIISTDPPYFDNIGYADLSDYFYLWERVALKGVFKDLTSSIQTPKDEELIANPHRHDDSEQRFLDGMAAVLVRMARNAEPTTPITIYYAFKQSDSDDEGSSSRGWETFLDAVRASGLCIVGTWPLRTERSARLRSNGSNALASSIVLVCRRADDVRPAVSRRDFVRELGRIMPLSLAEMTADPQAAIAPVDLAQAAIGPGMAVYSTYSGILEADGSLMSVHNALVHINKAIDDYFAHAEGDLDAETRFCIGWFEQFGFEAGDFGQADVLARAKGTSVDGAKDSGVVEAGRGKVRLYGLKELPKDWDPTKDSRVPVWEALHHLCRALGVSEADAGVLLARMPEKQDAVRQLSYRLYTLCERKGWAEHARAYNDLITSWPAIVEASHRVGHVRTQMDLV